MRIDIMNTVIGAAAGGADEVLEWMDRKAVEDDPASTRLEPLKGTRDWGRIVLAAVGFVGQAMDFMPHQAAALAQSQMPLLVKTASMAVRNVKVTETKMESRMTSRQYSTTRTRTPAPASRVNIGDRGDQGSRGTGMAWRPKLVGAS